MLTKEEKKNKERQSQKRKYNTLIKNQFKKIEAYLQEKKADGKESKKLISETQSVLDKTKNKKIIHRNKTARHKSREQKKINKLNKEQIDPEA